MKRIVFAGGGTAGHVMPNLSLISALKNQYDCVYVGGDGMEKDLCAARGVPFTRIDTVKLRRDAVLKNVAVPFKLISCVKAARSVLADIKPDLIFSKGGYAALPVVLAAKSIGAPVLAHESDMTPGIVTKMSKRRAVKILCSFEPCAQRFKNGVYTGAPLDKRLYTGKAQSSALGFDGRKPVLLVMGGSSGAAALNSVTAAALDELTKTFDVVHVTGKNKKAAPPRKGYKSMEFCDRMPDLYAATDIAVTRGGANALAELIALGIPAVCVPLEKASRGDQIENAEYYSLRGAVSVVREKELSAAALVEAVGSVWRERNKYKSAMSRIKVDGTDKICEIIRGCIE